MVSEDLLMLKAFVLSLRDFDSQARSLFMLKFIPTAVWAGQSLLFNKNLSHPSACAVAKLGHCGEARRTGVCTPDLPDIIEFIT